jgi:hypothetical protein
MKRKFYFKICLIWAILLGKYDKKIDCLTEYYIKQHIRPNLGNTFKHRAPITSVPEPKIVLSWSDLTNIWSSCFCLPNRKRQEQRTYSQTWTYPEISKYTPLAGPLHILIWTLSFYCRSAAEMRECGTITVPHWEWKTQENRKGKMTRQKLISTYQHQ